LGNVRDKVASFPFTLGVPLGNIATPVPRSLYIKNVSIFQTFWTDFRKEAQEELKIPFDNIVEAIGLDLNDFIKIRKNPFRQNGFEVTTLSKSGWSMRWDYPLSGNF
jgi:hypothetical protein